MAKTKRFFYTLSLLLILSVSGAGQKVDLSSPLSIQIKEGKLENALQTISDKTGLRFAFRNSLIQDIKTPGKKYNALLDSILSDLLTPHRLCFTIQNNQVIIHQKCISTTYKISGLVFEKETSQPLPYVFVSIAGKNTGAIADHNGYYEFETAISNHSFDTLVFSSMGFERDTLIIPMGKTENLIFFLKKKIYSMDPVVIYPTEYLSEKEGNNRDYEAGSLYIDTHGQQTALYVKNKKEQKGFISSVEYYLSDKGNTDAPFRVRIYEVDTAGKPGCDLIQDAVIVKPQKAEGWYSIDISKLKIPFSENGVFIAIEGVFPDEINDYYGDSEFINLASPAEKDPSEMLAYGQRIGYNRKCRKDTWHYSMSKVWFQLDKQSFGVMIAAVVKYEKQRQKDDNHETHKL